MRKLIHIIVLMLSGTHLLFAQSHNASKQSYHLLFQTTVNNTSFSFDSVYQNHSGEAFRVRSYKYYISHIRFVYEDGKIAESRLAPHLINEADSSSKRVQISVPKGRVTGVRFLLGIDSATNVGGVQSGDLDPVKGMFWIWNTGYIMAKLEGSSPSSKAPGKQYSYDIGGYRPGENAAREITLSLESFVSDQPTAISQLSTTNHQHSTNNYQPQTFIITADISKWFYGKNEIRINEQSMCHSPGALAMQVADNYAAMFSISIQ